MALCAVRNVPAMPWLRRVNALFTTGITSGLLGELGNSAGLDAQQPSWKRVSVFRLR
jgi:hypothetical protein